MHVAIVTAGGAGMFCGSCMHDNTLARALQQAGAEVSLIPTYTPIRVDEHDESDQRVFLGGINVYLDGRFRFWRRIPRALTRWMDSGWFIRAVSRMGVSNDAAQLGQLTLDLLAGANGPQAREIAELVKFIADLRPDAVLFSNALLAGVLGPLRAEYSGRVYCLLQGDDIFLQDLPEPYRTQALDAVHEHALAFDGLLVHSRFYEEFMAEYFRVPRERFAQVPLGLDFTGFDGQPVDRGNEQFTVGYFARICPEKGLQQLVAAFELLHQRYPESRLVAGGYLGPRDQAFYRQLRSRAAALGDAFRYIGSPESQSEKVAFYKSVDVLSVPTVYREPKGLPVLEALANGTPVIQPRHGAFPEMIEKTGGGLLVEPGSAEELATALESLGRDADKRLQLARAGYDAVRRHFDPATMAARTIDALSGVPDDAVQTASPSPGAG